MSIVLYFLFCVLCIEAIEAIFVFFLTKSETVAFACTSHVPVISLATQFPLAD